MPALLKLVLTTCTLVDVGQGVREVIRRHKQVDLPKASLFHAEAVVTSIMNFSNVNLLFLPELDSSYQTDDVSPVTCQEAINSFNNSNLNSLMKCSDLECVCELMVPSIATLAQVLQADQECGVGQPVYSREMMEQIEPQYNLVCGDESNWPSHLFETCISPVKVFVETTVQFVAVCRDSADYSACLRDSYCSDAWIVKAEAFNKAIASEECLAILSFSGYIAVDIEARCNSAAGA